MTERSRFQRASRCIPGRRLSLRARCTPLFELEKTSCALKSTDPATLRPSLLARWGAPRAWPGDITSTPPPDPKKTATLTPRSSGQCKPRKELGPKTSTELHMLTVGAAGATVAADDCVTSAGAAGPGTALSFVLVLKPLLGDAVGGGSGNPLEKTLRKKFRSRKRPTRAAVAGR